MASEMRKHLVVLVFACTTVLTVVCATHSRSHADDDDDDVDHPNSSKYCACNEASMNRRGFPDGFIFGSGSAAYQVEGGYNEDGKGPSMWDHFTHTFPEKIQDGSTGDVAIDSYHLYKDDVQLLKNMGADAYKFSISWSRILPGGSVSKGVEQRGIDYYNNLINELLANDIQPWVTMLHLDTPQALEDAYGGFLSPRIVNDFRDFADVLFSKFGDRVKYWMTINEPWGLSYLGYTVGVFAPGRCSASVGLGCTGGDSATEPYIMTHNQLLAHAAAVKLYKTKYQQVQKGKIGIIVNSYWYVPYNGSRANLDATDRAFDFMLGWVMDPITYGKYPESMRKRVGKRLPEFTKEEEEMVKGSIDFLALNYYSGKYALDLPHDPNNDVTYVTDSGFTPTGEKDGIPIGEQGNKGSWYYTYPKGLRGILSYIKLKYNDPVIYITENGLAEDRNDSLLLSEVIQDYKRKQYLLDHLCCLQEAIQQDGANVKGYFTWSLTDNYQWVCGFSVRFGIHYIDYADKSLKRHPKLSAEWLKTNFARTTDQKLLQTRSISDQ